MEKEIMEKINELSARIIALTKKIDALAALMQGD
jgi:hypothetical protein